jgi:hypothetical protein
MPFLETCLRLLTRQYKWQLGKLLSPVVLRALLAPEARRHLRGAKLHRRVHAEEARGCMPVRLAHDPLLGEKTLLVE